MERPVSAMRLQSDWQRVGRMPRMRRVAMRYRRSRLRRVMKWVGLVVCAVLVAAWAGSGWWAVRWTGEYWSVQSFVGYMQVDQCRSWRAPEHRGLWSRRLTLGSFAGRWWPPRNARWPHHRTLALFSTQHAGGGSVTKTFYRTTVPYWLPFLVVAVPTVALWWSSRPFPRGHCPACGYDLTGNTSGRCPECGERC